MKKKLNLLELELKLPAIDENNSKILLGGSAYDSYDDSYEADHGCDLVRSCDLNGGIKGPMEDDNNLDQDTSHDGYYDQDDNDHGNAYGGDRDDEQGGIVEGPVHYIADLDELPDIEIQSNENNCMATNMEFINEFFTGVDGGQGYIDSVGDFFHDISGQDMDNTGIPGQYLDDVINEFFYANQLQNGQDTMDAINNGNPVFAGVEYADGTAHAITIVGYNEDTGGLIYIDTATGQVMDSSIPGQGFADIEFAWEITGVR